MQQQLLDHAPRVSAFRRLLPVIIPVFLAVVYYGLIASDRYVATASFVVRGAEAPKLDVLNMLTGLPGAPQSMEDGYILRDYLFSRDFLASLRQSLPLEEIFRRPGTDVISRMESSPSLEDLQDYWSRRVVMTLDKSTGIATLSVSAFAPEDAMKLLQALLDAGEARINDLSLRSRHDTLKMAENELTQSVKELNAVRARLSAFRIKHNMFDPTRTAVAQQGIAEKLEQELVAKTVERASLLTYMRASAPQVATLDKRIASIRQLLEKENARNIEALMTHEGDAAEAQALMDEYTQMNIDREVAEKTYIAAIQFLETARIDNLRQRRYVAVFAPPRLPEEAIEPRRLRNIAIVIAFSLLLWGIGQLVFATIREHRQWNI